jgi:hypothetical protein
MRYALILPTWHAVVYWLGKTSSYSLPFCCLPRAPRRLPGKRSDFPPFHERGSLKAAAMVEVGLAKRANLCALEMKALHIPYFQMRIASVGWASL